MSDTIGLTLADLKILGATAERKVAAMLMPKLATAQLEAQTLREALEVALVIIGHPDDAVTQGLANLASTSPDTAALDAYVAEKVEPWKKDAERWAFVMKSARYSNAIFAVPPAKIYPAERHLNNAIDAAIATQGTKA